MIVPRSSAKPHHGLHSVQFASSWPAMSGCCVWAQFNFSPLSLSPFNQTELGWAQLKLSWAGPTRSDCYSAAASADIFYLKSSFFSTVQLSLSLIIQLSSVELGWPHKLWLRSADQLSSAQLKSYFPTQLKLSSTGASPTRSDCRVHILFFFSSIFFSSAQVSFSNSAEADFSWPHKVWLRSADQLTPHSSFTTQAFFFSTRSLNFMQFETRWISGYFFPDTS